ncbi:MAG: PHP domain-containing protein [Anaerolineales bacterium]|nr:PHP domain-containing protein [Chloroflexota bacterium]MBL6982979.1 PHP domain-containing protein [Anaerolineales bacterium]
MDNNPFIQVDFHCHTIFSPDSLTAPEKLIAACRRKGIDRIVVTDHNTIEGALRAKEIDPEIVIMGEEILTTEGELLAIFVQEEIPAGLSPQATIARLREQGAFISVSHPFDILRKGHWSSAALQKILPNIDAVETFNARCLWPGFNWQASKFARQYDLPGTHGSDAHAPFELGRGSLLLPPFNDADSLRESLKRAVSPQLTLSGIGVRFFSRYAVWKKRNT